MLYEVITSTVSRVLTDSSRVDPATKRRVLAELNYRPSQVARNLRRSQTRMIALLVPDIANPRITSYNVCYTKLLRTSGETRSTSV